ncbi:hypothetical protein [Methylobacter sp. S3L5C]|uniref:hypothetical protein n=1 Tax=Methylobacter sp. S3L5C TaxID=2839024 RepID=UPI001FACFBE2|nr:hypothetical protein [Methylobacter sp. S3L5C]UOA08243.1 hypothetical protein KKZ03_18855 [Methylobacter sp. S3L5C]
MQDLTEQQLYQALQYAKNIDEDNGKLIMSQFETDQPILFQTIFGIFPSILADKNQDMAHLFMDLCFEIICVYQNALGDVPKSIDDPTWMERQTILLETDFQLLRQNGAVVDTKNNILQGQFIKDKENPVQIRLVKFLNESIDEFASASISRVPFIEFTQAIIFVVVKLFNNLYNEPTTQ